MHTEIKYDPRKTILQIAKEAGLKKSFDMVKRAAQSPKNIKHKDVDNVYNVEAVMARFDELGKDYSADRFNVFWDNIHSYFEKHPKSTNRECVIELGLHNELMTYNTIKNDENKAIELGVELVAYLKSKDRKIPHRRKGAVREFPDADVPGLDTKPTDEAALKEILRLYLPRKKSFDCELTYGEGAFYKKWLAPRLRYDKYPVPGVPGVKNLGQIESDLALESLQSVVVDLPIKVRSKKDKKSGKDEFDSVAEMFDSYQDMILLAKKLLKPGGILVFKTSEAVLRDENLGYFNKVWTTDFAIEFATENGLTLEDQILVVKKQKRPLFRSTSTTYRTSKNFNVFLVFRKI